MRTVQDILFGVAGQLLVFDAPEGRASSLDGVTVYRWDASDDDDPELATSATAIESGPATTTDAACGAAQDDPRRVPVAATTGAAAGRVYLITGADALQEWIDVAEVEAADALVARHPLHNDYATGATVQSTRLTATVDPTWCSDDDNLEPTAGANPMFRVRWLYTVAGEQRVADTYFNLVRYAGRHGVRPQDVELTHPGWLDRLPIDHRVDQGRRLIDEAFRAVKLDLHAIDVDDAAVAEPEVLDELTRYQTVVLTEWSRFIASVTEDETRHLAAERKYTARRDALIRITTKVPIRDEAGAAAPRSALPLTRR